MAWYTDIVNQSKGGDAGASVERTGTEYYDFSGMTVTDGSINVSLDDFPTTGKAVAHVLLPEHSEDYIAYVDLPPAVSGTPMGVMVSQAGNTHRVEVRGVGYPDFTLDPATFNGLTLVLLPYGDLWRSPVDPFMLNALLQVASPPYAIGPPPESGYYRFSAEVTHYTVNEDILGFNTLPAFETRGSAVLVLTQGSTGGVLDLDEYTNIVWADGTPHVLSTTEGKSDVLRFTFLDSYDEGGMGSDPLLCEVLAADVTFPVWTPP